jgi:agmatine/peptidylarginine deiminase
MDSKIIFPAEWEEQSAVQLTWPHPDTDWCDILDKVIPCFVAIAKEILKRERLIIVCRDKEEVKSQLGNGVDWESIIFREMETNDTWARDHAPLSVFVDGEPFIYDFGFNGWGLKFPANWDNMITRKLYVSDLFRKETGYFNMLHFILEGGSVESDGKGTLLTTSECLLSPNRNDHFGKEDIEDFLQSVFGVERILWLDHGYLAGDDTDSHIDTLARFCDPGTIAYVKCDDPEDEHFEALSIMEEELKAFKTKEGKPYRLIPLPMADVIQDEDGNRLPATYANFLIINGAVLMPGYSSPEKDSLAKLQLQKAFPGREIVEIDCCPLVCQHGSLHCVTMQYPFNLINE